ncbi:hypothetical protein M9458_018890, partial [Cirrhinus mrigala]
MLATDASLTGWGVVMNGHPARGLWSGHHPASHISCLEMLAMFQASRIRRILTPMALLGQSGAHRIPRSACQPCREPTPQSLPPGNIAKLGSLPPLSVSFCRRPVTGHRASGSHKSRGCRLFGSVEATAKCICMGPAYCRARLSHLIRCFAASFQRGLSHFGEPRAGNGTGSRESGFYSRYFIVPKTDGGLRLILDLRLLNCSVMRLKFKMLTVSQVVSQIRSEDWFVMIDLKDTYFHVSILPQHRKFLRFAFSGKAYQYRVLPFGLALSPRTFTKCVDASLAPLRLRGIRILNYIDDWLILAQSEHMAVQHRDVVLAHMKELGLRLNAKKSVLSPLQRTTYLGVVWDSTMMQARLSPARIDSILTAVTRVKEGRSLTVKQFQRLLGLMAAASNVVPFGLLYMRPLQWWLRTKGFSPRGNPFRMIKVTRRCLRALDMRKKPWFL